MTRVELTINGLQRQVEVQPETVLLDLLRNDLHLTGTKQSCDRKANAVHVP